MTAEPLDRRFMAAAIRLGRSALGTTWPNPAAVGAILVKDGTVIARGRTAPGGRPHAEAAALAEAGKAARGATLYVSLEPCMHQGRRGGPCVDAIIAAGVRRVVGAAADPDDRTNGRGFRQLREAGIEVVSGVLAAEAKRGNPGHHKRPRDRPHVTLKLAVSADDAIGRDGEAQVPVTGATARRHVQALRSRFDAILVGRGTVEADDPQLTCRLPGLAHRSPVRVVLDSEGGLSGDRRVFSPDAPVWVLQAVTAGGAAENVRRLIVPRVTGGLDLEAAIKRLGQEGLSTILIEGGARVARSVVEADLVDTVMLFRSSADMGDRRVPALAGMPLSAIEASERFGRIERRRFGSDMLSVYRRIR